MGTSLEQDAFLLRKKWRETWFRMAKGNISDYNNIKSLDVFEFWPLWDLWLQNIKSDTKKVKQNGSK